MVEFRTRGDPSDEGFEPYQMIRARLRPPAPVSAPVGANTRSMRTARRVMRTCPPHHALPTRTAAARAARLDRLRRAPGEPMLARYSGRPQQTLASPRGGSL